ncbi:MAG TPA: cobalamin biosynthesis protein, partial [Methyloceanibacter sp.]|nr:cobalamin biosynthesis protein [Methyloceanibacter sp.]
MSAFLTLLALAFEAMFGYPRFLVRSIGHPVGWIGKIITGLDDALNRDDADAATKRRNGVFALALLLAIVGSIAVIVELGLSLLPFGIVLVALLASTLLAQRSLY